MTLSEQMGMPYQIFPHPASAATQAIMEHQYKVIDEKDVDGLMSDYAEDAFFLTPYTAFRNRNEIRAFYTAYMAKTPQGFLEAIVTERLTILGEVAYILWSAEPWLSLSTATWVVRGGKIVYQTAMPNPNSEALKKLYMGIYA
ncbi:MAG: nuclear transport factor 2 family protein [Caldilineaceae bacterium]